MLMIGLTTSFRFVERRLGKSCLQGRGGCGSVPSLQRKLTEFALGRVAKSALAGLLAVLLLACATLSTCDSLHQKFHAGSSADHFCLVCNFAKGQVNTADVPPVAAVFIFCFLGIGLLTKTVSLPSLDIRLSPSRAPPVSSLL